MKRLLAILALCVPALAYGATYYAAPGGGTATNCTDAGANVCTAARAIVTATDGDTVSFAAGTYPASELHATVGYLLVTSENLTLTCAGAAGSCILQPSAGSAVSGIRFNSPTTTAMTVTGFKVDTSVAANGISECFYSTDGAAQYALTWTNNTCDGAVTNYAFRNTANEITLTLSGNTFNSPASATPAAFFFTATTITTGSITSSGNNITVLNTPTTSGGFHLYRIQPAANGITVDVSGETSNVALGTTASANVVYGYRIRNVLGTKIHGNTINVTGTGSALQYIAASCGSDAAVSSAGCQIYGNTINHGAATGQAIQIQSDATGTGDNQATASEVYSNTINCDVDGATTHGVIVGYTTGGIVWGNFINNCGIGVVSKEQTTGAAVYSNVIYDCYQQCLYSKGSNGATFVNNTVFVGSSLPSVVQVGVNSDTSTDSTNAVVNNNIFLSVGGQPATLFDTAASQTFTATGNDWYGFTSPSWEESGTAYTTLANWNARASVGTDLAVDPLLACTQAVPTCAKTKGASTMRRAGTCFTTGSCAYPDYRGRQSWNPPDIGAFQHGSRDQAATRTAR